MADSDEIVLTLPPVHAMQAECRVQIHDDLKLRLSLQEWENNFKRALVRIESKRTRTLNVKNELYQLISFYSVFQGVVLTAVAQASTLKCRTAWGPASLSAIASVATLFGVHNKLIDYYVMKSELKKEEDDANVTKEKISLLKLQGKEFKFSVLDEKANLGTLKKRPMAHELGAKYYWLVMIPLILFSIIVLLCGISILCSDEDPSRSFSFNLPLIGPRDLAVNLY